MNKNKTKSGPTTQTTKKTFFFFRQPLLSHNISKRGHAAVKHTNYHKLREKIIKSMKI